MQKAYPQTLELATGAGEPDVGLGHRTHLQRLGLLDDGTHDVGLVPVGGRGPDRLPHAGLLKRRGGPRGGHRRAARRQLVERRHFQVPVDGHGCGARDRRGRHDEQVRGDRLRPLAPQHGPLLHAEPVLLVDHHHSQGAVLQALGYEGVGAHHDVHLAGGQPGDGAATVGRAHATGQQIHAQGALAAESGRVGHDEIAQHRPHGGQMLLGEDLGGSHERPLEPALHGREQGAEGNDGLARPDVALEQAVHGVALGQIGPDLLDDPLLSLGQRERQAPPEPLHQIPVHGMAQTGRVLLQMALPPHQLELHAQELVEHEPAASLHRLAHGLGPVDPMQRGGAVDETEAVPHLSGHRVSDSPGLATIERLLDEAGYVPGVEICLLGLRVDGKEAPGAVAYEVDHGIGHLERAPIRHRPAVDHDLAARLQALVLPGLVEEREPEPAGVVADHGLDEGPALPGAPRRTPLYQALHEDVLSLGEFRDAGLLRPVDVAAGIVLQQIEHRVDLHPGQRGRLHLANRAESADTDGVEFLEAEGRVAGRHRRVATRPAGLLQAEVVRVQGLTAVAHLDVHLGVVLV